MKVYAFLNNEGAWYSGLYTHGAPKYSPRLTDARLFSEDEVLRAEYCRELGLACYEMQLSEPVMVAPGHASKVPSLQPPQSPSTYLPPLWCQLTF